MKKYLILFSATLLISSCSSLRVSYDYDTQADFSRFKTYAHSEENRRLPISDLDKNRLIAAIDNEMAAKGFTRTDTNPDVLIDLYVKKEQGMTATANTMNTGMGMGMGPGPWRHGWGGGFSTTQINYNKYVEGTLFINMIDMSTNQVAWQGRATKTLEDRTSTSKRTQNINNAVKSIFTKYPPRSKR